MNNKTQVQTCLPTSEVLTSEVTESRNYGVAPDLSPEDKAYYSLITPQTFSMAATMAMYRKG